MMRRGPEHGPAVIWLTQKGVWNPKASHAENMRRCAEYRASIGRMGAEPGKQWANEIVQRYRNGERLHHPAVRLAFEALGLAVEPAAQSPSRKVPRPDQMERAAGDVEVSF